MQRILLLLVLALPVYGRSLHWTAIDVDAHLDRDGRLRVVERQQIVFDGDWNGGERVFGLRPRQNVEVHRIVRMEGDREIPLSRGDLNRVDAWQQTNGAVRWRSRLPSDPPFDSTELTYVLEYTYSNVLVPEEEQQYRLLHDFGLPDRSGVVERFTLHLDFDPIWGAQQPVTISRTNLQPGEGVVAAREVTYDGAGDPAGVERPLPVSVGLAALGLFAAGAVLLVRRFIRDERAVGRFDPVPARFADEVLSLPAEVAGAAWDAGVGAPEVAAALARMAQEGKLTTRVEEKVLHLRLETNRESLEGYERELIDRLFFDGRVETDTDAIREHYSGSGFDPAAQIAGGVEAKLDELPGWRQKNRRMRAGPHAIAVFAAAVVVAGGTRLAGESDTVAGMFALAIGGFFTLIACVVAHIASKTVTRFTPSFSGVAACFALGALPLLATALLARPLNLHAATPFILALWYLVLLRLVLDLMKITDPPAKIAFRKRIAATRRFFIEQLAQAQPAIRDEWFPYVLAFGLGTNVDRWFRTHGSTATSSSTGLVGSSSATSAGRSVGGRSWTGGGGTFGGAGATGSWVAAAGGIAAGVAAPSSSGSSSGGGGGGSSSGGGGGGGW